MIKYLSRARSTGVVLAGLLAVAALIPAAPASASPRLARAARTCSPPKYPGIGYFTSLSVSGTSCSTGDKVALAYYRCRLQHGKAGTCRGGVLGFACREQRNAIPTEIEARVSCRKGSQAVVHTYQQDT
ncbi:MAG TPA: hypothetical protein VL988_06345 [Solirubrobacteraceae bacterium]|nr:hypothetical protein [Solirubrobacteraceae bacterium]